MVAASAPTGTSKIWAVEVGLDAREYWFRRTDGTRTYDGSVNLRDPSRWISDWIPCPILVLDRTWHRKSIAQRHHIEPLNDRPARYSRKGLYCVVIEDIGAKIVEIPEIADSLCRE